MILLFGKLRGKLSIMIYNRVMTIEHGNFPPSEPQATDRLQLMTDFGRFLVQHGERGNRVDPATMEHSSDKTYRLDDFEGVVYRAREQFGGNTDLVHKATASYAPVPVRPERGSEELGLMIIGIDQAAAQTTVHDYRAMNIGGNVAGDYTLKRVPMNSSEDERLRAMTHPVESRRLAAIDFSFLRRVLQELRDAWE